MAVSIAFGTLAAGLTYPLAHLPPNADDAGLILSTPQPIAWRSQTLTPPIAQGDMAVTLISAASGALAGGLLLASVVLAARVAPRRSASGRRQTGHPTIS